MAKMAGFESASAVTVDAQRFPLKRISLSQSLDADERLLSDTSLFCCQKRSPHVAEGVDGNAKALSPVLVARHAAMRAEEEAEPNLSQSARRWSRRCNELSLLLRQQMPLIRQLLRVPCIVRIELGVLLAGGVGVGAAIRIVCIPGCTG